MKLSHHTFASVLNTLIKKVKTPRYYYCVKSRALAKEDFEVAEAITSGLSAYYAYKRIKKIKTL